MSVHVNACMFKSAAGFNYIYTCMDIHSYNKNIHNTALERILVATPHAKEPPYNLL